MGEAKRRKQVDQGYGKGRNAIYIGTIFLNQALLAACSVICKLHPHLFTEEEWDLRINRINIFDLVPFLVEYGFNKNEFTSHLARNKYMCNVLFNSVLKF